MESILSFSFSVSTKAVINEIVRRNITSSLIGWKSFAWADYAYAYVNKSSLDTIAMLYQNSATGWLSS